MKTRRNIQSADHDDKDREFALSLVPVSRETEDVLQTYVDLLHRWQAVKNLVGFSTLQSVWSRHVADSAQLPALMPDARHWIDLGTGAGFPGLVIAILLRDVEGAQVDLVESNERKCAFLREAVRACRVPARVHMGRIEQIVPTMPATIDVVTSRALAPLPVLVEMSAPLLANGAIGLFPKGAEELGSDLPDRDGPYAYQAIPSRTGKNARIIKVTAMNRNGAIQGQGIRS